MSQSTSLPSEVGDVVWFELLVADLVKWDEGIIPIGSNGQIPWGFEAVPHLYEIIADLESLIEQLHSWSDIAWLEHLQRNSQNYEGIALIEQYIDELKGRRSLVCEWKPTDSQHISFQERILASIDSRIERERALQESGLRPITSPPISRTEQISKAEHVLRIRKSRLKNAERKAKQMTKFIQSLRTSLGLPLEP